MKKLLAALIVFGSAPGVARAADMPEMPPVPMAVWSWTGFYVGGQFGAASINSQLTDPAGAPIYGNNVRSPAYLAGLQAGYNWQMPNTGFVAGVEVDASLMGADGSATCLASSPNLMPANCRVRPQALGSVTGRLGYAAGPFGRTLFYGKGGVAWLDDRIDITTNGAFPPQVSSFEGVRWGWTLGAGVERALTPAWSLRLEYDYASFGDVSMNTPGSLFETHPPRSSSYVQVAPGNASIGQSLQTVKVGLNYKIGEDMNAQWAPSGYSLRGGYVPDSQIEMGGRVWYSSGRFQKDLGYTPDFAPSNLLISRLTYDSTAVTGELFGRIDTPSQVFLKGFVGGGSITSGNMHDEDFAIGDGPGFNIPYSNTSSTNKGDLAYGTFDAGYSVFHGPSANVGGFLGFNYYRENKSAYGCNQISNNFSDCVPAFPTSTLLITEDDKWYSMRVGINGVVSIWDRLKLTVDAAYLPFVTFRGTDVHLQRFDVANQTSPEQGSGQGVQFEALLSYAFANGFNIGAGGRYWAMWAPGASVYNFSEVTQTLPVRTERYGAFVQASYKFDGLKF